jgi:adenylate cyclase
MIGGKTYEMAKDKIEARFLANMIVKGKTEPVPCYELLAKKGELSEAKRQVVQIFEEGWHLHAARNFNAAIGKFDQALSLDPHDGPSKTYKKICEEFLKNPPSDSWAGEYIQTSK